MNGDLETLCGRAGIETGYRDAWGEFRSTPAESLTALLEAMGFLPGSGSEAPGPRVENGPPRTLPPVQVIRETASSIGVPVLVPSGSGARVWELTEETGTVHRGEFRPEQAPRFEEKVGDGARMERRRLEPGVSLPLGYHRLTLGDPDGAGDRESTTLIVVPETCYLPERLQKGSRDWGYAVQLYALRSSRNWGIGDFGDLRELLRRSAAQGARLIGVNPLHALYLNAPWRASPYAPSSRLHLNPVYLDVEAMEDYRECAPARESAATPAFQAARAALRDGAHVDYPGVVALKLPVLEALYWSFRDRHLDAGRETDRGRQFRAFQTEGGEAIRRHGIYEVLAESFPVRPGISPPWREWPAPYRRPDSPEVLAFARERVERVEFHQYLQWQADLQLGEIARLGAAEGIGLFRDLAVGASADGSEAWANPAGSLDGIEVGAPPDPWNPRGQKWGFPPPHPGNLEDEAYGPFRELLRSNMRHADAIRIDHVMGLARLFCVPAGRAAVEGAYVPYPFEDLLGILALESRRHRCLVVGEDLGTVPPGMRERLQAAGVLSCRLLYFERDPDGGFARTEHYPRQAMVALTTHDLPTAAGFWSGHDLEVKRALDLFRTPEEESAAPAVRDRDRQQLLEAFSREGLSPEPATTDDSWAGVVARVHAFLARTPSMLFMANLSDLIGQEDQVNIPGTPDAEPNWRLKVPVTLEEIFRDPLFNAVAQEIELRRGAEVQDEEGEA